MTINLAPLFEVIQVYVDDAFAEENAALIAERDALIAANALAEEHIAARDALIVELQAEIATLQTQLAQATTFPVITNISDLTVDETTSSAVFRVTMDRTTTRAVNIDYTTVNGTATAGQDYTATSGILVIVPGALSATVSVPILNDAAVESNEAFTLALSNARLSLAVNDATGSGVIVSEDVEDSPPQPGTFDPRTMTVAQIAAETGPRVTSFTQRGSTNITQAGTYKAIHYSGTVTVQVPQGAGKVIFEDCIFDGLGSWYAVICKPEDYRPDEIRFEYCEGRRAVNIIAGPNLYVYRCDLHDWENGVNFWGPCTLVENYIHTPSVQASGEPHYDGVECNGGGGHKLFRNYVINTANQTAALMFNNWGGGSLSNIEIDGNWVGGGGYTIYFDTRFQATQQATFNIKVTNNTIKRGYWGYLALYNSGVIVNASGGNQFI